MPPGLHDLERLDHIIRLVTGQKPNITNLEVTPEKLPQMFRLVIASINIMPENLDEAFLFGCGRIDVTFLIIVFFGLLIVRHPAEILKMMDQNQCLGIGEGLARRDTKLPVEDIAVGFVLDPELLLSDLNFCNQLLDWHFLVSLVSLVYLVKVGAGETRLRPLPGECIYCISPPHLISFMAGNPGPP